MEGLRQHTAVRQNGGRASRGGGRNALDAGSGDPCAARNRLDRSMNIAVEARLAAALTCGVCAGVIAAQNNRRVALGLLIVQYAAVTLLVTQFIPVAIASVKLAGGLIAGSILGGTLPRLPQAAQARGGGRIPTGRSFRLISVLVVVVAGWSLSRDRWMGTLPLESYASFGSSLLMTLGL